MPRRFPHRGCWLGCTKRGVLIDPSVGHGPFIDAVRAIPQSYPERPPALTASYGICPTYQLNSTHWGILLFQTRPLRVSSWPSPVVSRR